MKAVQFQSCCGGGVKEIKDVLSRPNIALSERRFVVSLSSSESRC